MNVINIQYAEIIDYRCHCMILHYTARNHF